MKTQIIEIIYNGEPLGYPVHLFDGENPDVRILEYQKQSAAKITWREWKGEK